MARPRTPVRYNPIRRDAQCPQCKGPMKLKELHRVRDTETGRHTYSCGGCIKAGRYIMKGDE